MLTEQNFYDVIKQWKDATEPQEVKAMIKTFIKEVIITNDSVKIEPKLKIASTIYEGSDFTFNVERNKMKRHFLVPELE
jgi:hypothetical protein